MSSPLEQAGAAREPSEYATISMDREITGLWTQRSPLRDADVPYLYGKFYSASRFDSLIDGINREISARLTNARAPGSSVYNSNTFPAANSFYSYKSIQNGAEVVRVLLDGQDGKIYDATAGQKSTLFTKSSGAGKTRFLGVNTELFFTDGVDLQKWLFPGGWQASTNVAPGTLINVGAEPGTMQMALGGISLPLVAYASSGSAVTIYVNPQNVPSQFPNLVGALVSFAGTGVGYLDSHTYAVASIVSTTLGIFTITLSESVIVETTISGTGSTGAGTTGSTAPTFSTTEFAITADSSQQWKCYAGAIENWGLQIPANAPILTPLNGTRFWQPNLTVGAFYAILDNNGSVEVTFAGGTTGRVYPTFSTTELLIVLDGTVSWENIGTPGTWQPLTKFAISYGLPGSTTTSVILDSNNNLQYPFTAGTSGSTAPTWATTVGTSTTDGTITWKCLGPGVQLTTAAVQYAFSTHGIDGSVCTASPVVTLPSGVLGPALSSNLPYAEITGNLASTLRASGGRFSGNAIIGRGFNYNVPLDPQIDQIWIWRTPQGQSTLILEDQIPSDGLTNTFTYNELGIPDTSTTGGGSLNAEIAAPIASSNNPPQTGMTAPAFFLERAWAILGNAVVYSGGPDTLVGNGDTAFPPLNSIPFPEQPIKLRPTTVNNGGLLVETTSNVWIILGTGTLSNPFYTTIYMPSVGILSYDAEDIVGSTLYMMTGKSKLVSLDPSAGYVEFGFPIGDQFKDVTTGAGAKTPTGAPMGSLYSPSTAFVTWAEISSGDTGVYVSDGAYGWFRYSPVASPESGFLWSPRRVIVGGTSAVQAVETSPGITQLLIGPPTATPGPILFRDSSVNADWSGGAYVAYPSYDVKGNIVLCQSGEVAEIAHIGLKSTAVGARPAVGLLLGEIAATETVPFDWLSVTSNDPPDLEPSQTLYSDRYTALQNGECPKCDNFQLAVDYGTQNEPDELLMFSVYGAKHAERKQQ